jgi:hypothetical protein
MQKEKDYFCPHCGQRTRVHFATPLQTLQQLALPSIYTAVGSAAIAAGSEAGGVAVGTLLYAKAVKSYKECHEVTCPTCDRKFHIPWFDPPKDPRQK